MSDRHRRGRPPTLYTLAHRLIRDHRLFGHGDRVVCACSGGPDSTALLHVLALLRRRVGHQLTAVGVDHGLRGAAGAELALAAAIAHELEVPFVAERVSVASGGNLQERARRARLAALQDVAAREGAAVVATGHTADDRAETVLMRLLRNAGPRGLAVLPPRAPSPVEPARAGPPVDMVRPLLLARRTDVEAHLARHGLASADDPSNRDRRFLRVRVRHELIPQLEELSPRIVEHLCALADMLWAAEAPGGGAAAVPDIGGLPVVLACSRGGTRVQDSEWVKLLGRLSGAQRQALERAVRLRKGGSRIRVRGGGELELRFFAGTPVLLLGK